MTDPAISLALPLVREFEGCELHAYPDPASGGVPWTIGYGCTGPGIGPDTVWSQAEAEAELEARVTKLAAEIRALLHVPLPDKCIAALCSFAHNVGLGNLQHSTLLAEINDGEPLFAAAQFLKWTHAAGRELPGLARRRIAERDFYVAGLNEQTRLTASGNPP